ncbi:MAG: response regulator transcription factor [Pseudomonadales bacterium]|nr:response regulator transcription factor [Pseudomonadales bacterium]
MLTETTVYIVDDEACIRSTLCRLFRHRSLQVEDYASATEFLQAYCDDSPGCLLADINMPGMDGLALQQALNNNNISIPVIFITGSNNVATAVIALKSGAFDFVQKPFDNQQLVQRVNEAIQLDLQNRNNRLLCSEYEHKAMKLTPREKDVMHWLVAGKANKVIARLLDISSRTVEIHRKNVLQKMQADFVSELIQMSLSHRYRSGSPATSENNK